MREELGEKGMGNEREKEERVIIGKGKKERKGKRSRDKW